MTANRHTGDCMHNVEIRECMSEIIIMINNIPTSV